MSIISDTLALHSHAYSLMDQEYFQALTSSDENEFTFWLENQPRHPEVLNLLVKRYAADVHRLGFLWLYGYQQEQREKTHTVLPAFVQEVFSQAFEKIPDVIGQESASIWLYGIAIQVAKRYRKKDTFRQLTAFFRKREKNQHPQETDDGTHLRFKKALERLLPSQRLILALRHVHQIDLSHIAAILARDVRSVRLDLSALRQLLFESLEKERIAQASCSHPEFKSTIQACYDRIVRDDQHIPWDLEDHLSECKSCDRYKEYLEQLGKKIANELGNQPSNPLGNLSDRSLIIEYPEARPVSTRAKLKRVLLVTERALVPVAIFLATFIFAVQFYIQDTHLGIPLYLVIPQATPASNVQLSRSFQVSSVEQTRTWQLSSIYNLAPGTIILIPVYRDAQSMTIKQNEPICWLPGDCFELYNEIYKWFYYDESKGSVSNLKNLVYSPNGVTLAGLSIGSKILFWETDEGQLLNTVRLNHSVINDLAYAPDGIRIAIGSQDGTVTILTNAGQVETTHRSLGGPVFSLGYSPDGKTLTVGGRDAAWSWDIANENLYVLDYYSFPESQVASLDYSPDGNLLAFGLNDGTIWIYRSKDAIPHARLDGHRGKVLHVTFSPDGMYLASGATDGNVILWDISDPSLIIELLAIDHHDWIMGLEFSPDGTYLATTSLGNGRNVSGVYLWKVPEGNLFNKVLNKELFTSGSLAMYRGRLFIAGSLAFSPDGRYLAIGSLSGSVKLWQIPGIHPTTPGKE